MRHLELENITRPNRKRRIDVLERLTLGVRPLRHGHRHDHRQVLSLHNFSVILGQHQRDGKLCSSTTAAEWTLVPCGDKVTRHFQKDSAWAVCR
jgi:hypothetical protein